MKNLMKPFGATLLLVLSAPLAFAEETTVDQAVGAANTSWIMTATALVLFMTLPGLALFYGGLVHKKNVLSVLMHCFAMACILSVVWLVAGYSLALEGSGGWIGDLSSKDPFYVLPILMGVSMYIQQKLNPPPTDAMQQKIFLALPFIFTALFATFPSGLVLYWLVNNILSIAQQYVINKRLSV